MSTTRWGEFLCVCSVFRLCGGGWTKLGVGSIPDKSVSFEKSVSFSDEPPDMNSPKQHSPQHGGKFLSYIHHNWPQKKFSIEGLKINRNSY